MFGVRSGCVGRLSMWVAVMGAGHTPTRSDCAALAGRVAGAAHDWSGGGVATRSAPFQHGVGVPARGLLPGPGCRAPPSLTLQWRGRRPGIRAEPGHVLHLLPQSGRQGTRNGELWGTDETREVHLAMQSALVQVQGAPHAGATSRRCETWGPTQMSRPRVLTSSQASDPPPSHTHLDPPPCADAHHGPGGERGAAGRPAGGAGLPGGHLLRRRRRGVQDVPGLLELLRARGLLLRLHHRGQRDGPGAPACADASSGRVVGSSGVTCVLGSGRPVATLGLSPCAPLSPPPVCSPGPSTAHPRSPPSRSPCTPRSLRSGGCPSRRPPCAASCTARCCPSCARS